MFDDRMPTGPLVIGHRGASADHPENTVAAFRGAADQGADWVELDVRRNHADELVVRHDPRFADERSVWSVALADAPDGTVDLERALNACAPMGINIEIKNSPGDLADAPYDLSVADLVVDLVRSRRAAGIPEQVLISSFDLPTLDRVRHLAADVETGYLVLDPRAEVDGADAMSVAATRGHTAVHPWDPCVDAAVLARCAELGLRCNVWTVDDLDRAVALATLGVDGIVTNTPRRMVGALRPSG